VQDRVRNKVRNSRIPILSPERYGKKDRIEEKGIGQRRKG